MSKKVAVELKELLGVNVFEGETRQQFILRLVNGADTLPKDDWEVLSTATQVWVNTAVEACLAGQIVPVPEGLDDIWGSASVQGGVVAVASQLAPRVKKGARRGPKGKFGLDGKITILVEKNPFRANTQTFLVFSRYISGMTVQQAIDAGIPRSQILWDFNHGSIRIE